MAKPKSHKQPNKAAKAKKAAKQPAEAPEVQASAPSELQSQADTPVASEPLPEVVVPPAATWADVGDPHPAHNVPIRRRQARRWRFQSSSIAIGMTSLRITGSLPRWVRGRNRMAS